MNHYSSSSFLVMCLFWGCLSEITVLHRRIHVDSQSMRFKSCWLLPFSEFKYIAVCTFFLCFQPLIHSRTADSCWTGRSWDWGGKRAVVWPSDWGWTLKIRGWGSEWVVVNWSAVKGKWAHARHPWITNGLKITLKITDPESHSFYMPGLMSGKMLRNYELHLLLWLMEEFSFSHGFSCGFYLFLKLQQFEIQSLLNNKPLGIQLFLSGLHFILRWQINQSTNQWIIMQGRDWDLISPVRYEGVRIFWLFLLLPMVGKPRGSIEMVCILVAISFILVKVHKRKASLAQ